MQPHRHRFKTPNGERLGTLQSCIRTDDLESVGDGTHLTSFQMVGSFSFGRNDYEESVELWHSILGDLSIDVSRVHVHPDRDDHRKMWEHRGYSVFLDNSCTWSDGDISGECCELFCGQLEIGNLVNPLGNSTDVGFGLERIYQVIERCERVEQTSLFDNELPPRVSDHVRTLKLLRLNGVEPGNRGREYVCRRLIRRVLPELQSLPSDGRIEELADWIDQEQTLRDRSIREGRRVWRKFKDRPSSFWWQTFGILPEELHLIE